MPIVLNGSGPVTGVTSLNTTVSDTELGYLDGVTSALQTQINSKLNIAGGKILQIVRATDSTTRTTTSTSLVDASISVTITPQRNDSAVLLIWATNVGHSGTSDFTYLVITDNSNNAISGANGVYVGSNTTNAFYSFATVIGYATPATTSAVTYKGRFRVNANGTAELYNGSGGNTAQLYAIEVSA